MKKYILFTLLLTLVFSACQNFDDLEKDPNRPGEVPPSLLFTNILYSVNYSPWGDEQRWNQFWCSNYAYYDDQEYDWTTTYFNYDKLKNVQK